MTMQSTTGCGETAKELAEAIELAVGRLAIRNATPRALKLSVEAWDTVSGNRSPTPAPRGHASESRYAGLVIYLDESLPPHVFRVAT